MKAKRLELTVSATVPKGMGTAHFRALVRGQLGQRIYLSIYDQIHADTNAGTIRVAVSGARRK
jgi:hypothetical protein